MNTADVQKLYAYNDWANQRMLTAIEALTPDQFAQPIVSSFPSVRETLLHIAGAEWIWLQRWTGVSPSSPPSWITETSFDAVRNQLGTVASDRAAFLASVADDALPKSVSYRNLRGDALALSLGDMLVHCANHSTYHRGQLVTMLRQLGCAAPGTDYMTFALGR